MNITLGSEIKINDEIVPEYLLKALYECLKLRYPETKMQQLRAEDVCAGSITAKNVMASRGSSIGR